MRVTVFAFFESSIQLVPDGTLLVHLLLIVGMVALLNATLLKPINRVLEERELRTKGRLSEAAATLAVVDERMREYEHRLRQARTDGYSLMERERTAISQERDLQVTEVRAEISRWLSQEQDKLKSASADARKTLDAESGATALQISRQILKREIREDRVS